MTTDQEKNRKGSRILWTTTITLVIIMIAMVVGVLRFPASTNSKHDHDLVLNEVWDDVQIEQDTVSWDFKVSSPERSGIKFKAVNHGELSIVFDGTFHRQPYMEIFRCKTDDNPERFDGAVKYVIHTLSLEDIARGDTWKNFPHILR